MSSAIIQFAWSDPQQAAAILNRQIVPWAKSMMLAGHKLVGEIRLAEDAKTDRQRAYYHGVILKEIACKAEVGGEKFSLATWKEHFRNEYLGFKTLTFINPFTKKKSRRRIRVSTEDLGVKAYANLIERVTAFAVTDLGVGFSVPNFQRYEALQIDPETGEILGGL